MTCLLPHSLQVAPCYAQELKDFPLQLAELLEQNANSLDADLRKTLVQALILLRNRNLLSATALLSLFFKLFRVRDKPLRLLLRSHIVNDIRRSNAKKCVDLSSFSLSFLSSGLLSSSSPTVPPLLTNMS